MRHTTYLPALLAATLVLGGCASSGSAKLQNTERLRSPTVITDGEGNTVQLDTQREFTTRSHSVALPIEQAYRRLLAVYDVMGIEPRSFSERDRFVGNQHVVARRRFGNRRLSTLLDCGSGMTGPHADQYEVTFSIVTQLTPEGDASTRVTTRLIASARPMGASGTPVACSTKGALEQEIVDRLSGNI